MEEKRAHSRNSNKEFTDVESCNASCKLFRFIFLLEGDRKGSIFCIHVSIFKQEKNMTRKLTPLIMLLTRWPISDTARFATAHTSNRSQI